MKSIKEMAEEWSSGYMNLDRQQVAKQALKHGANYVLDILEKNLPLEDDRNLNDYGKALVWRLKDCIEQLKK